MDAGKFTLILHLLSTMLLINCAMSYDKRNESQINNVKDDVTTEWMNKAFVATTPTPIKLRHSEDSDEDNDDGSSSSIPTPEQQARQVASQSLNPVVMVFNALSNALIKSASNAAKNHPPQFVERSSSDDDEYYEEEEEVVESNRNGRSMDSDTSSSSSESSTIISNSSDVKDGVFEGRQNGAYIKGDPLNGYYDFVITEGSYKFWVVFQLFTAGLLIYSTLAAIYYSKVNPLTSDYDYVDYLSRSFHGRSMDSTDVEDDSDSTTDKSLVESGRTYLSSLSHNKWVRTAAYGFQFAMDAIDHIPK